MPWGFLGQTALAKARPLRRLRQAQNRAGGGGRAAVTGGVTPLNSFVCYLYRRPSVYPCSPTFFKGASHAISTIAHRASRIAHRASRIAHRAIIRARVRRPDPNASITGPGKADFGDHPAPRFSPNSPRFSRQSLSGAFLSLLAFTLLSFAALYAPRAQAQPFDPGAPQVFAALTPADTTSLYTLQTVAGGPATLTLLGTAPTGVRYIAMGFSAQEGYLYGVTIGTSNNLVQIGQDGQPTDLGAVSNLPLGSYNIATFGGIANGGANDYSNVMFVADGGVNPPRLYAITGIPAAPTATELTLTGAPLTNTSDMLWTQGYLWAVDGPGQTIYRIAPDLVANSAQVDAFSIAGIQNTDYGGQWAYGNGNIGIYNNATGTVYQIAIANPASATPTFNVVGTFLGATPSGGLDAANSFGAPVDLGITKTATPNPYTPGQPLTYTLTVTNGSTLASSSGYVVNDPVPAQIQNPAVSSFVFDGTTTAAGTCTVTGQTVNCVGLALPAGGSAGGPVTGTGPATANGAIATTATVTGNEAEPAGSTLPNSSTFTVNLPANVRLSKSTNTLTLAPNLPVPYTVTATNDGGTEQAAGYTFTEVVPANTTFTSLAAVGPATATITGCVAGDPAGTQCTVTLTSPIPAGASAQVTFTVTTLATLPAGVTHIVNQVYYDFPFPGCSLTGTPVCNPVQPSGCVGGVCTPPPSCVVGDPACSNVPTSEPNVRLTKTTTATALAAGEAVPYTITATNTTTGTTQAGGYTFTEVVPANTTFTGFAAVAPATATIIGCNPGDPAGTQCQITVTSQIDAAAPAQVTFTVTTLATLPPGATGVVNQAYYDVPWSGCSLGGTPVCNPGQPAGCAGGVCTPPPSCVAGDPACTTTLLLTDMQATGPVTVPAAVGGQVSVTTTCTNNGPVTAVGATCDVTGAPAGATTVCTPSSPVLNLAVGASISCLTEFTSTGTTVTLTTTAGSLTPDLDLNNNTAPTTLGAGVGPGTGTAAVPTLHQWAMALLMLLLVAGAVVMMRRGGRMT
jgi:fimbrial isopeptide formation D2 family protein/uncharacterized repeat protein (TIGR01451 family)